MEEAVETSNCRIARPAPERAARSRANEMKFLSVLLVLFQFSSPISLSPLSGLYEAEDPTTDEYAVYSALIQTMYVKKGIRTIVIAERTQFSKVNWERREDYLKSILEELRPVSQETIEDFEKMNQQEVELASRLNLTVNYELLDPRRQPSGVKTPDESVKYWAQFFERYPDSPGIISLSRVGFSSGKDQAVVYVSNLCGDLCGKGYYVLLINSDKGWKVQKEMMLWVS